MKEEMELNLEQLELVAGGREAYPIEEKVFSAYCSKIVQLRRSKNLSEEDKEALKELRDLIVDYPKTIKNLPNGTEPYTFDAYLRDKGYGKYSDWVN